MPEELLDDRDSVSGDEKTPLEADALDYQKQGFSPRSRFEVNVAFIGQKGIPATFGGIEAHVDELSRGLARRGHGVNVYVRNWYTPRRQKTYQGVKLIHVPTIKSKHLDAAVHSLLSSLHCLFSGAEIIHYHGIGPALFSFIPRFAGRKVVATIHRLDWASEKWGRTARLLLKMGERASVSFPNRTIAVSRDLRQAILSRDGRETIVIPNGIDPSPPRPLSTAAAKYGLSEKQYLLFMGRLVPEKRPEWIIKAFTEIRRRGGIPEGFKLVIAGGSSETAAYVRSLKTAAKDDPQIILPGYVRGEEKEELLSHALAFVLPSRLEGNPIALLEAKSYGLGCLVSDIEAHKEIITDQEDGVFFRTDAYGDFLEKMNWIIDNPGRAAEMGRRAGESLRIRPGWDAVVEKTLEVYRRLLRHVGDAAKPGNEGVRRE